MSDNWSAYRDYWDNHARAVGAEQAVTGLGNEYEQVIGDVLRKVAPHGVHRVLDIGCGAGRTYPVVKGIWPDCNYYGVDVSIEMIAYCTKKFPDAAFAATNSTTLLSPSDYMDLVICHSVFTHIFPDDVMEYLNEIKRVLTVIGRASISIHTDTEMNWHGSINRMNYRPDYFEGMLEDAGLKIYNRIPGNQLVYGVGK